MVSGFINNNDQTYLDVIKATRASSTTTASKRLVGSSEEYGMAFALTM